MIHVCMCKRTVCCIVQTTTVPSTPSRDVTRCFPAVIPMFANHIRIFSDLNLKDIYRTPVDELYLRSNSNGLKQKVGWVGINFLFTNQRCQSWSKSKIFLPFWSNIIFFLTILKTFFSSKFLTKL